jgi:phosphatidylserine/phosphatidylglycerophosphate/cardiolipin synthase-like enzyme
MHPLPNVVDMVDTSLGHDPITFRRGSSQPRAASAIEIARTPEDAAEVSDGWRSILKPQRNCWKVLPSRRASVLVDGADYFKHLSAVLAQARRSILIIGWDFDGSICLRPDCEEGRSIRLGAQLRNLVEIHPDLEVRILVWSMAVVHAPSAPLPQILGSPWEEHPRIQVRLDTKHPIYGAHHQKIV